MLMSGLEWFIANNLFLNAEKTKYIIPHKPSPHDSISLRLPTITFNSMEMKCEFFIRFLGVIDKNITWNKHIELVENKI